MKDRAGCVFFTASPLLSRERGRRTPSVAAVFPANGAIERHADFDEPGELGADVQAGAAAAADISAWYDSAAAERRRCHTAGVTEDVRHQRA
jgi:hypothetical protein